MQTKRSKKLSLFLILSVGFIDYLGLGLVFPLFTFLLFDTNSGILPPQTSDSMRGLWLGLLLSLAPMVLFFSSPLLGTLSDLKGRKKVLSMSLAMGFFAYLVGVIAVLNSSLILLIASRILYGISAGSTTVVQAGIVDLSTGNEKQKNFGLYSMALGAGFSLGPFIGGVLAKPTLAGWFNYATPFAFAALLSLINWMFILWKLKETHVTRSSKKIDWTVGVLHLKKAFQLKEVRLIFCVMFLFFFGWNFFSEFISVFLMKRFGYTQLGIGSFYAYNGLLYALCAGFLIRPIIKRFPPKRVLEIAFLLGGIYFFFFLPIEQNWIMWIYLLPLIYFISMVYPTATTVISNDTSKDAQGEILGIYGSIQSLALIVSPFCAGSLVAQYPFISIIVAGSTMFLSGVALAIFRIFRGENSS